MAASAPLDDPNPPRGDKPGMAASDTSAHPVRSHADAPGSAGMATDPVCGMSVDPATARYRAEHAGTQYFFCGARCLERFTAEPERFAGRAKPAPPSGAGSWTC